MNGDLISVAAAGWSRRRFMAAMLGSLTALETLGSAAVGCIANEFFESGKGKWQFTSNGLLVRCYYLPYVNEFWSRDIIEVPESGIRIVEASAGKQDAKQSDTLPIEWKLTRGDGVAMLHQMLHPVWNWRWQAAPVDGILARSALQVYARQASNAPAVGIGGAIVGVEL